MFSIKKNVLQTIALLKAYGVDQIVISPGSRNAPLVHSFNQDPFFKCYSVVDERNAGFFAIGLINNLKKPVALCCTSGTALLNYSPAVAEAFYQELPLVVVSADRSPAWIGQMDGQTLPQPGAFGSLIKKSVQLPEIHTKEDLWFCNRLINEALMECTHRSAGPVHINIPISEPLFDFSEAALPEVRKMQTHTTNKFTNIGTFNVRWKKFGKRMILLGQMPKNKELIALLETMAIESDCVVLCEHLSNASSPAFIGNFDALLSGLPPTRLASFAPELLITLGGHVVSKEVKKLLRSYPPQNHWHISPSGNPVDSYQCLTDLIETDAISFLKELSDSVIETNQLKSFALTWELASSSIFSPEPDLPFSDISVVGTFLEKIPEKTALFVGNSSSVRNIQLYTIPSSVEVYCNRGTNGIEGAIATATGFAVLRRELTFLLIGDLSFFYDLNALWFKHISNKLRILLINNGGGGIFRLLPGLEKSEGFEEFVAAQHVSSAEDWVKASGLKYLQAKNMEELEKMLPELMNVDSDTAIVLEVFTTPEMNKNAFNSYYNNLKN